MRYYSLLEVVPCFRQRARSPLLLEASNPFSSIRARQTLIVPKHQAYLAHVKSGAVIPLYIFRADSIIFSGPSLSFLSNEGAHEMEQHASLFMKWRKIV